MKGNNESKLEKHFSSAAHKAALRDFCNFMQNNGIDTMLDKKVKLQKSQKRKVN